MNACSEATDEPERHPPDLPPLDTEAARMAQAMVARSLAMGRWQRSSYAGWGAFAADLLLRFIGI